MTGLGRDRVNHICTHANTKVGI